MAKKGTISVSFKVVDDGDGIKRLAMDGKELKKILEENAKAAKRLQSKFIDLAAKSTSLKNLSDAAGQLKSTLNDLTSESMDFNKAMRAVNTMAGKDSAGFEKMKDQVADLAKTIPIARDELANGLYQTISNGVPEGNWIEFLNTSARSAVGGMADLGEVVGVTSTIIKNYGLEWDAAAGIQDKIQLTAKNGVTSFEQLAQALPRVAGNAATLGVSIDELMASFATLTGVSGNTSEVSTQLAAIFTALVKPSSEAAQMAEEMGIQFDAAAIKAAGGFTQFLTKLDASVKSYAKASGVLEQEVYGRLFGSADSLRALVPLQGELASKFHDNVASMVDSAGTMDAAYADMASTGEATTQILKNKWGEVTDVIAGFTSMMQPYISFTAQILSSASSVMILVSSYKALNTQQTIYAIKAKGVSLAMALAGISGKSTAATMRVLSATFKTGAFAATSLKIALRGLLISTGIGIAIWAVTEAVNYFASASDNAADSTDGLTEAQRRQQEEQQRVQQAEEQEKKQLEDLRAQLELNIAKTKDFHGTKEEEQKIVNDLNNTYGDTMGYFSSVADWYKALVANSQAYCQQMIIEARIRRKANDIAAKEEELESILRDGTGKAKMYSTQKKAVKGDVTEYYTDANGNRASRTVTGVTGFTSDYKEAVSRAKTLNAEIGYGRKQMTQMVQSLSSIQMPVQGSKTAPAAPSGGSGKHTGGGSGKHTGASGNKNNKNDKNDKNDDKDTRNALEKLDDQIRINQELALSLEEDSQAFKDLKTSTLELVKTRDKLRKQQDDLVKIPEPEYTPPKKEDIKTYEELDKALTHYREELDKAQPDKRPEINAAIKDLEALREAWDKALNPPADTGPKYDAEAKSLAAMEENVEYLNEQLSRISDLNEATKINTEIKAWNDKADAIRNAGLEAKSTFETLHEGYDTVRGIGDGIQSVTSALQGNGDAWQAVTGIIDGFFQIYEGVSAVIAMINTLTTATTAHTAATIAQTTAQSAQSAASTQQAAATVAASTAEATSIPTAEAAAVAQVPVIAANKAAAASFMELAAASYFAAHAAIPFVGFGIAAGFTAAAKAMVLAMGATPFAEGGIVSGPTLGLVGEYAGAANNPEVIAPLDRLRALMDGGDGPGELSCRLKGSDIEIVYDRRKKRKSRM